MPSTPSSWRRQDAKRGRGSNSGTTSLRRRDEGCSSNSNSSSNNNHESSSSRLLKLGVEIRRVPPSAEDRICGLTAPNS